MWLVVLVTTCSRVPRRSTVRRGTGRRGPRNAAAPVVPNASTCAWMVRSSPPGALSASNRSRGIRDRTVVPVASATTERVTPAAPPASIRTAVASSGRSGRGLRAVTSSARVPSKATETVSSRAIQSATSAVTSYQASGMSSVGSRKPG